MTRVLVLGATSAIAQEIARLYAARAAALFLVARNAERLEAVADDLRVRGASVETAVADLDDSALHEALLERAAPLEIVLLAHGVLGDPSSDAVAAEASPRGAAAWKRRATDRPATFARAAPTMEAKWQRTTARPRIRAASPAWQNAAPAVASAR